MADPSSITRARRTALVSSLALLMGGTALVAAPSALAQAQQSVTLTSIAVQGNERIDSETVASYLPLTVGDTVDARKLDTALKALFKTDLFSDVKLDLQGTSLIVRVVENPV
ncbi:MAG TPA: POTRA domain-containing protein, partial [Caulobacteraceae bacterium]